MSFFRCPRCVDANIPLAFYCRKCGQPLDFEQGEKSFAQNFEITTQLAPSSPRYQFDLKAHGIQRDDVELMFPSICFGNLSFLTRDGRLILVNLDQRGSLQVQRIAMGEGAEVWMPPYCISRKHSFNPLIPAKRSLLVFTSQGIYEVDLLDNLQTQRVFPKNGNLDRVLISQPIYYAAKESFLLFLYDRQHDQTSLQRLDVQGTYDLQSFNGKTSQPIKLSESTAFFYTPNEMVVYDLERGPSHTMRSAEPLDISKPPRYSNQQIYVAGGASGNAIYRIQVTAPGGMPSVELIVEESRYSNIKFNVAGNYLLIGHNNGFSILNIIRRQEVWSSAENLFVRELSSKFSPSVFGKYLLFHTVFRGQEMLTLLLTSPNYDRVASGVWHDIVMDPLLYMGHLFVLEAQEERLTLKVYVL